MTSLYKKYLLLEACFGNVPFIHSDIKDRCGYNISLQSLHKLVGIGLLKKKSLHGKIYFIVSGGI